MAKSRADNNSKESGIALVTALVITVVVLMLISSLTYLFTKGFQTNIINRQFSTVYEAANGGVEYTTGLVNAYLSGTTPSDTAIDANFSDFSAVVSCTEDLTCSDGSAAACVTAGALCNAGAGICTTQSKVKAKTADGTYTITTMIQCLGSKPIPGYGGALTFPPKPAMGAGGTATKYIFYSIISQATETTGSTNIGKTEAIYRVIQ